jgi:hypothetical protein
VFAVSYRLAIALRDVPLLLCVLCKVFEVDGLGPDFGVTLIEKSNFSKSKLRKVFKRQYLARPGWPGWGVFVVLFWCCPCVYYMRRVKGFAAGIHGYKLNPTA